MSDVTAHPVSLGGLQVTEPVRLGPYITAGQPASVGARRLEDMPEVRAADAGSYLLVVAADGTVTLAASAVVGATSYHHTQLTTATVWTISHGLSYHPAGIIARDSAGDLIEPDDVDYVDTSTTRLVFLLAVSGSADLS